ncbi:hypothetical protein [Nonomuraea africana]
MAGTTPAVQGWRSSSGATEDRNYAGQLVKQSALDVAVALQGD